jgi:hypothetical protein
VIDRDRKETYREGRQAKEEDTINERNKGGRDKGVFAWLNSDAEWLLELFFCDVCKGVSDSLAEFDITTEEASERTST